MRSTIIDISYLRCQSLVRKAGRPSQLGNQKVIMAGRVRAVEDHLAPEDGEVQRVMDRLVPLPLFFGSATAPFLALNTVFGFLYFLGRCCRKRLENVAEQ
jgi:hypothetical protein